MTPQNRFEKTAVSLASLNKLQLKKRIKNYKGRFKLDFTDEYLEKSSVDKLRHILLAAMINSKANNLVANSCCSLTNMLIASWTRSMIAEKYLSNSDDDNFHLFSGLVYFPLLHPS